MHARHGLDGRLRWARALYETDQSQPEDAGKAGSQTAAEKKVAAARTQAVADARRRQKAATEKLKARIHQAAKSKRSRRPSRANTSAAVEYARTVRMVNWLVNHPTECDQLSSVVKILVDASSKLLEEVAVEKREEAAGRIRDHLWCDLIASMICVIEKFQALESNAKQRVAENIAAATGELLRSTRTATSAASPSRAQLDAEAGLILESLVLQACIREVVVKMLDGATGPIDIYLETVLVRLRIAGLMLCPDMSVHDLVWEHCWVPLWKNVVQDEALNGFVDLVGDLKAGLLPKSVRV